MTMDLYIQDKRLWYEPPGTGIMNRMVRKNIRNLAPASLEADFHG